MQLRRALRVRGHPVGWFTWVGMSRRVAVGVGCGRCLMNWVMGFSDMSVRGVGRGIWLRLSELVGGGGCRLRDFQKTPSYRLKVQLGSRAASG